MPRLILVHWNAEEGRRRLQRLRRAGHRAGLLSADRGAAGLRAVRGELPDLFVIDLDRIPSQGRAVGTWLRQQKATRRVPIVFVVGDPGKTARVRQALPDAAYTTWGRIAGALRRALARPPGNPVVPGTMDVYSGRPLAGKLGIRGGSVVALLGAPARFERQLGRLPDRTRLARDLRQHPRTVLLFTRSRADLARRFPAAARSLAAGGALWIAWPKRSSGVATDLTQQTVRAFGLGAGFVDYKICAIDGTWSGLCFARRRTR